MAKRPGAVLGRSWGRRGHLPAIGLLRLAVGARPGAQSPGAPRLPPLSWGRVLKRDAGPKAGAGAPILCHTLALRLWTAEEQTQRPQGAAPPRSGSGLSPGGTRSRAGAPGNHRAPSRAGALDSLRLWTVRGAVLWPPLSGVQNWSVLRPRLIEGYLGTHPSKDAPHLLKLLCG